MTAFISRNEPCRPGVLRSDWGVCDQDMFAREELDQAGEHRQSRSMLRATSQPCPARCQKDLPGGSATMTTVHSTKHPTTMRYSDGRWVDSRKAKVLKHWDTRGRRPCGFGG